MCGRLGIVSVRLATGFTESWVVQIHDSLTLGAKDQNCYSVQSSGFFVIFTKVFN